MRDEKLNLIPDDLLNLIFNYIKPSIKYTLNKNYFNKFFKYRFILVNKGYIIKNNINTNLIIKNLYYIKYLINNKLFFIYKFILENKIVNNDIYYIFTKKTLFEGMIFNNLIDFSYYYCKKYNSQKILEYITLINKKNNCTLIKKEHKNKNKNNKNNKWKI